MMLNHLKRFPRVAGFIYCSNGMKIQRIILCGSILSLILFTFFKDGAARTGSWGYINHASTLSAEYLETTVPEYDVICLTGFRVTDAGTISIESAPLLDRIAPIIGRSNATIYPLISFRSAAQGHRLLNSTDLSEKTARSIRDLAGKNGFSGVHLDFEYLPPSDSQKLHDFLVILRKTFRGAITMAVFPQVEFPEKWSRFHDLRLLAPLLDAIVLMCYDLHGAHTGPGPVTSIEWADRNVIYAVRHMEPKKIWIGIPAYGYCWTGGKAAPLPAARGARLSRMHGSRRDSSGNIRIDYEQSGKQIRIYYSDRETRKMLTKLAVRHGLAGTALWRLGFED